MEWSNQCCHCSIFTESAEPGQLGSRLIISNASSEDSGNYSCNLDDVFVSTFLHVLRGNLLNWKLAPELTSYFGCPLLLVSYRRESSCYTADCQQCHLVEMASLLVDFPIAFGRLLLTFPCYARLCLSVWMSQCVSGSEQYMKFQQQKQTQFQLRYSSAILIVHLMLHGPSRPRSNQINSSTWACVETAHPARGQELFYWKYFKVKGTLPPPPKKKKKLPCQWKLELLTFP